MATIHRNLSRLDPQLPSAADMKFGIVVSQWNPQITGALLEGAVRTLRAAGCEESSNMPVAFGVLTTENLQQAIDRAGGKYGNKGDEAAMAAIRMVALQIEMAPDESEDDRKKVN